METILLGFGRAGKIHYNNMIVNKDFKLTHIVEMYDISDQITTNIKYVNSNDNKKIDELLKKSSIKAVIICTPTKTHHQLILKCLQSGKHVFVEKPACDELTHITEAFDLAVKKKLILFTGYNRRFDPTIADIK